MSALSVAVASASALWSGFFFGLAWWMVDGYRKAGPS